MEVNILTLDSLIQSVHSKTYTIRSDKAAEKRVKEEKVKPDKDLIVKYPIAPNVIETIANYYTNVLKRTFQDEQTTKQEINLVGVYLQNYLKTNRGQKGIFDGGVYIEKIGDAIKRTINHAYFYESIKEENEID